MERNNFMTVFVLLLCNLNGFHGDEVTLSELARKLETVEKKCEVQEELIERQNAKIAKQAAEIEHLQRTKVDVESHKETIKQIRDEMFQAHQRNRIAASPSKRNARFMMDGSETVAFHATLKKTLSVEHLHINQTVVFDNVMLNVGGAYNSQNGVFVATIEGIYIFSVSIMGLYGTTTDSIMVFIMKNGKEIAAAIADGRGGVHDQGSTTVVLQLVPGDQVWVSVQRHDDTATWTDGLDSFMGVLVAYL